MKITVYTVTDCQFSKQEIEYLKSHNLQFEEKNLETNKDFLTEMLAVGDNFAGTPVTRVEKDDGQITILKGFTQEEFNVAFGFKKPEEVTKPSVDKEEITPASTPVSTQPSTTQPPTVIEPAPIASVVEPPTTASDLPTTPAPEAKPPVPETPPTPPETPLPSETSAKEGKDEKLSSVLDNLQSMSNQPAPVPTTTDTPKPASTDMPSIPDPKFG